MDAALIKHCTKLLQPISFLVNDSYESIDRSHINITHGSNAFLFVIRNVVFSIPVELIMHSTVCKIVTQSEQKAGLINYSQCKYIRLDDADTS